MGRGDVGPDAWEMSQLGWLVFEESKQLLLDQFEAALDHMRTPDPDDDKVRPLFRPVSI
jgi:hypothetical protein